MASVVDEAIGEIDQSGQRNYRWTEAEDNFLKQHYGLVANVALAEKITRILRRETGDPEAFRSPVAISLHCCNLGLKPNTPTGYISVMEAVKRFGMSYTRLRRAYSNGTLKAIKIGKILHVHTGDLAIWELHYREIYLAQEQALEALEGKAISKPEAMKEIGLSESQITRYIKQGVIKGYAVPERNRKRGFWLIDKESVRKFKEARNSGELQSYLNTFRGHTAYLKRSPKRNYRATGPQLRMDYPRSAYHPGCFTVSQVAGELGALTSAVYGDAKAGKLKLVSIRGGGRKRYAVRSFEARRYVEWVRLRSNGGDLPVRHKTSKQAQKIAEEGLFTVRALAIRWGVSENAVLKRARKRLRSRLWGRYRVFEVGDIERYEKEKGLSVVCQTR